MLRLIFWCLCVFNETRTKLMCSFKVKCLLKASDFFCDGESWNIARLTRRKHGRQSMWTGHVRVKHATSHQRLLKAQSNIVQTGGDFAVTASHAVRRFRLQVRALLAGRSRRMLRPSSQRRHIFVMFGLHHVNGQVLS